MIAGPPAFCSPIVELSVGPGVLACSLIDSARPGLSHPFQSRHYGVKWTHSLRPPRKGGAGGRQRSSAFTPPNTRAPVAQAPLEAVKDRVGDRPRVIRVVDVSALQLLAECGQSVERAGEEFRRRERGTLEFLG